MIGSADCVSYNCCLPALCLLRVANSRKSITKSREEKEPNESKDESQSVRPPIHVMSGTSLADEATDEHLASEVIPKPNVVILQHQTATFYYYCRFPNGF